MATPLLPKIIQRRITSQNQQPPSTRKRNHSLNLHYDPQNTSSSPPSQDPLKPKKQQLYSARKNQLLSKQIRFKSGKNYTKNCQKNMNQFMALKNKVINNLMPQEYDSNPVGFRQLRKMNKSQAKKIRLKIVNILEEEQPKRRVKTEEEQPKRRVKTEEAKEVKGDTKMPYETERRLFGAYRKQQRMKIKQENVTSRQERIVIKQQKTSQKQYKEMSIQEITGNQHNSSKLVQKMQVLRATLSQRTPPSRKQSEEYQLQGW